MVISKTLLGIISLLMNCFHTELLLWSSETVTNVLYWAFRKKLGLWLGGKAEVK